MPILPKSSSSASPEDALPGSDELFRALFENMNEGFAYCRMLYSGGVPCDFEYLEVNKSFERLTGLSNVEGRRVSEVVPGIQASNPELFETYGRVASSGVPEKFDTFVPPLGIWFSISVYSPRKGCFVAVFENITARKDAEAALRLSEERLRRLVENVSDIITVINEKGFIQYQSPSVLQILGFAAYEMVGRNVRDVVRGEDAPAVEDFIRRALVDGEEVARVEFRITHKDGSSHILQSAGRGLPDAGADRLLVVTSRDVTEGRLLEEKFRRAQRLEAIGSLASGVAHDLNNILTPMLMASTLLKDRLATEHDREILAMVEMGAQRGASIVKQLLSYSRGGEGARVCVQVRHLIKEMVALMHETFPRSIEIEQRCPASLWTVQADATQIHQVLMNLCVNARDSMPVGGRLRIAAENLRLGEAEAKEHPEALPGPYLRISVEDTGTGISREALHQIFDPFFTTKALGKGTGLGLSTVMGIVKAHKGFIAVSSTVGSGSRFDVYLPASGKQEGEKPLYRGGRVLMGNGELVLVVDDEEEVLLATRDILAKYQYGVLTARGGREAIRRFIERADSIAVVLTDLMMPEMDGIKLTRSLRVIKPDVRVIATSGLGDEESAREIAAAGFERVLVKPCDPEGLLAAIREVISGSNR
jgi:PAS domain S-box-containing protein